MRRKTSHLVLQMLEALRIRSHYCLTPARCSWAAPTLRDSHGVKKGPAVRERARWDKSRPGGAIEPTTVGQLSLETTLLYEASVFQDEAKVPLLLRKFCMRSDHDLSCLNSSSGQRHQMGQSRGIISPQLTCYLYPCQLPSAKCKLRKWGP